MSDAPPPPSAPFSKPGRRPSSPSSIWFSSMALRVRMSSSSPPPTATRRDRRPRAAIWSAAMRRTRATSRSPPISRQIWFRPCRKVLARSAPSGCRAPDRSRPLRSLKGPCAMADTLSFHLPRQARLSKDRRAKRGGKGQGRRRARFVIQKHDATRLHYDLRLEVDGVFSPGAVTRGLRSIRMTSGFAVGWRITRSITGISRAPYQRDSMAAEP